MQRQGRQGDLESGPAWQPSGELCDYRCLDSTQGHLTGQVWGGLCTYRVTEPPREQDVGPGLGSTSLGYVPLPHENSIQMAEDGVGEAMLFSGKCHITLIKPVLFWTSKCHSASSRKPTLL